MRALVGALFLPSSPSISSSSSPCVGQGETRRRTRATLARVGARAHRTHASDAGSTCSFRVRTLCVQCAKDRRRSAKGKRSSTWPACCVLDRLPLRRNSLSRASERWDSRARTRACRVTPTVVVRSRLGSGSGSGISLGAGPIKVARTYNSTIVVLFIADADCFNCSVPFVRVSRVLCSLHSTAGFKKIRSKKKL